MSLAYRADLDQSAFVVPNATTICGDVHGTNVAIGNYNLQITGEGSRVTLFDPRTIPAPRRLVGPLRALGALPQPFVGRAEELANLLRAAEVTQAVEVVGPSGLGKSWLLRRAAHEALAKCGDGTVRLTLPGLPEEDCVREIFDRFFERFSTPELSFQPTRAELQRGLEGIRAFILLDDMGLDPEATRRLLDHLPASSIAYACGEPRLGETSKVWLSPLSFDDGLQLANELLERMGYEGEQQLTEVERDELRARIVTAEGNPRVIERTSLSYGQRLNEQRRMAAVLLDLKKNPPSSFGGPLAAGAAPSAIEDGRGTLLPSFLPGAVTRGDSVRSSTQAQLKEDQRVDVTDMVLRILAVAGAATITLESVRSIVTELQEQGLVHTQGLYAGENVVPRKLATLIEWRWARVDAGYAIAERFQITADGSDGCVRDSERYVRVFGKTAWNALSIAFFDCILASYARAASRIALEERGSLLQVLAQANAMGCYKQVLACVRAVQPRLVLNGAWGTCGHVLKHHLDAARALGDMDQLAWGLHECGVRALCLGELSAAAQYLRFSWRVRRHGSEAARQLTLQALGLISSPWQRLVRWSSVAMSIAARRVMVRARKLISCPRRRQKRGREPRGRGWRQHRRGDGTGSSSITSSLEVIGALVFLALATLAGLKFAQWERAGQAPSCCYEPPLIPRAAPAPVPGTEGAGGAGQSAGGRGADVGHGGARQTGAGPAGRGAWGLEIEIPNRSFVAEQGAGGRCLRWTLGAIARLADGLPEPPGHTSSRLAGARWLLDGQEIGRGLSIHRVFCFESCPKTMLHQTLRLEAEGAIPNEVSIVVTTPSCPMVINERGQE